MKKTKVNKSYLKRSLKFFKDVKFQLLIIAIFYILLGIIGFVSPIVEAHLITSITNALFRSVILIALGFLVIKILEDLLWHITLLFWKKKIRSKIY